MLARKALHLFSLVILSEVEGPVASPSGNRWPGNPEKISRFAAALIGLAATLALGACATNGLGDPDTGDLAAPTGNSTALERGVFLRVNAYRKSQGLHPLSQSNLMTRLAREHSRDMASANVMSHDGSEARFDTLEAAGFVSMMENVARNRGTADPAGTALERWKRSPAHHAAMLDPDDVSTGVGAAKSSDGIHYITQLFGQ